jgi:hypothetical protein
MCLHLNVPRANLLTGASSSSTNKDKFATEEHIFYTLNLCGVAAQLDNLHGARLPPVEGDEEASIFVLPHTGILLWALEECILQSDLRKVGGMVYHQGALGK